MKTVKIGVMPEKQFRQYMIDIATGRTTPKRGPPKIWFHSMKSLAEVLSDNNRTLLKIIAEEEPETIKELAEISGRQPSNLGRTLKTFERYGFIKMEKNAKTKKPIAKAVDFDIRLSA
jgi:predicted transcriptional regulator